MPQIGSQSNKNQLLFVGVTKQKINGLGAGGVIISPNGDHGGVLGGVQGDTMLYTNAVGAYTMTVEFLPTSDGIDAMIALRETVGLFPVAYQNGRYVVSGFGVIMNEGDPGGAETPAMRTVTVAFAKQAGGLTGTGVIVAGGISF